MKFFIVLVLFIFVTVLSVPLFSQTHEWIWGPWGDSGNTSFSQDCTQGVTSYQLMPEYGVGYFDIYCFFSDSQACPDSFRIDCKPSEEAYLDMAIFTNPDSTEETMGTKLLLPGVWNCDLRFTPQSEYFYGIRLTISDYSTDATFLTDNLRANGTVWEGFEESVGIEVISNDPTRTSKIRSYPNPTNPRFSWIGEFWVSSGTGKTSLKIYDISGRLTRSLPAAVYNGYCKVIWNGRDSNGRPVSSGTYLYRLETPSLSLEGKIVVVK